jgi:hypothetical protein
VFPVAFFDLARSPGLRPKARPGLPLPTLPTLPTIQALTKDGNQAKIKRLRDSPQMVTSAIGAGCWRGEQPETQEPVYIVRERVAEVSKRLARLQ